MIWGSAGKPAVGHGCNQSNWAGCVPYMSCDGNAHVVHDGWLTKLVQYEHLRSGGAPCQAQMAEATFETVVSARTSIQQN